MKKARCVFEAFCIKGEFYVFGGFDSSKIQIKSVEKYSPATNTWKYVNNMMDDRVFFSACSFMDNVFVIGGEMGHAIDGNDIVATCFKFNTQNLKWKEIT